MAKYNIKEAKVKDAAYRSMIRPELADDLKEKIYKVLVTNKKYRDPSYTAKKLASEINTNTRYISAVVNVKFGMNYSNFVNKYRIEDAVKVLANRQSFYAAFYRMKEITPRAYKNQALAKAVAAN